MRTLTKLNQVGIASRTGDGTPPEMPLEKILRDAKNPRPPLHLRTPEEQQAQCELNANVRLRGVKSPISLRPHPSLPDMWLINHGHCRYDAAEAAGFATIPYFVDPNFDSYDQVAENLHRCNLSIWAIAAFIKRKVDEGQSKSHIAERLGKDSLNYVTEHLALIDAPNCLHQAYANTVRSPRTLYDLRRAYDEFPEKVEDWCNSGAKITRDSIRDLLDRLRHDAAAVPPRGAAGDPQQEAKGSGVVELTTCADSRAMTDLAGRESFRHDVTPPSELASRPRGDASRQAATLRHDVMPSRKNRPAPTKIRPPSDIGAFSEVPVLYRGSKARILSASKVRIVIDGSSTPLDVPLGDLVFEIATLCRVVGGSDEAER